MSEEHPVFKVTDRRLFNADGTPREGAHEEEAKPEAAAVETKESASAPSESRPDASAQGAQSAAQTAPATAAAAAAPPPVSAQTEQGGAQTVAASEATAATAATSAAEEQFSEEDFAGSEIPGADDPASFINFLMSIASNAAAALGMMEHPVTGHRAVDPELGKHWIDVLGMLEQKTRGNLAPQEQQIFEGLLADLRMQYVSLTSTRPAPRAPRGFSGSDITGGK